ncbi:hypothetical protein SDC9_168145 [bioreactor metagenome]|uniref:Uncharacterized protein n=1 Tax=bioreactor metagenome TaxID=1076179 RepID=A0A645G3Q5_9ZZZZ
MKRRQQPDDTADYRDNHCQRHLRAHATHPEAACRSGQHHKGHGHQRAQRMKAAHQIEHQQQHEGAMPKRAVPPLHAQKAGFETLDNQRPIDQRQRQQRHSGDGCSQQQGGIVQRQHRAKQHMQQIDIGAAQRNQQHTQRQRDEIEARKARVVAQRRVSRDDARQHCHQHTRQQPAYRHRRQRQPEQQIAQRSAGKNGMRHRIPHQTHAPQQQNRAQRRSRHTQCQAPGQRSPHKAELGKGLQDGTDHGYLQANRSSTPSVSPHA